MLPDKRPLLIGITGNIGSGKSTLANYIREQGYEVISADELAKAQLESPQVRQILIERWGERILINGETNHAIIASIVFKQPTELAFLNSVVHPRVLEEFSRLCEKSSARFLFFEVPLLFEAGLQKGFDYIILVTAGTYTRELRLLQRDKISPEAIRERIGSQEDDSSKLDEVDLVIHNDSGLTSLHKRAMRFLQTLDSIPQRKIQAFRALTQKS